MKQRSLHSALRVVLLSLLLCALIDSASSSAAPLYVEAESEKEENGKSDLRQLVSRSSNSEEQEVEFDADAPEAGTEIGTETDAEALPDEEADALIAQEFAEASAANDGRCAQKAAARRACYDSASGAFLEKRCSERAVARWLARYTALSYRLDSLRAAAGWAHSSNITEENARRVRQVLHLHTLPTAHH